MASATANSGTARRLLRRLGAVALGAALLGSTSAAHADASAADKVAAEALFSHAKSLMKEGKLAEACPKFAESQRLDAGIGTMLYLADCYEKSGQTASAWGTFLEAAAVARAAGQADREKKARDRAAALETRLNRIAITLASGAEVPGMVVKRDSLVLGKALWGTAVPLDPGEHVIEATAPGKLPWSSKVQASANDTATLFVVVPVLADAPPPPEPPKPELKIEPPKPEPPKPEPPRIEPRRPPPPLPPPPPPESAGSSSARVAGYAMMGVGLASAAVGGILGSVVILKKADTTANCRADNVCTKDAAASRNSALDLALATNVALIAGGSAFAIGVVIIAATKPAASIDRQAVRVRPLLGPGVAGLSVGGAF